MIYFVPIHNFPQHTSIEINIYINKTLNYMEETIPTLLQLFIRMLRHRFTVKLHKCFAVYKSFSRLPISMRVSTKTFIFWVNLSFNT